MSDKEESENLEFEKTFGKEKPDDVSSEDTDTEYPESTHRGEEEKVEEEEEEKPKKKKKEKKERKKVPMTPERKARLLENLKRGRETARKNRMKIAKAKKIKKMEKENEIDEIILEHAKKNKSKQSKEDELLKTIEKLKLELEESHRGRSPPVSTTGAKKVKQVEKPKENNKDEKESRTDATHPVSTHRGRQESLPNDTQKEEPPPPPPPKKEPTLERIIEIQENKPKKPQSIRKKTTPW